MRYSVAIVGVFLLSCGSPTEACHVCTTDAIAYGLVVDANGQPVVGIPLDIRAFADDCPSEQLRGGTDSHVPRTDGSGRYRAVIMSLWSPFTARCFVIRTNRDSLPQWPMETFERSGELHLRPRTSDQARDSIRFDIQLPPL